MTFTPVTRALKKTAAQQSIDKQPMPLETRSFPLPTFEQGQEFFMYTNSCKLKLESKDWIGRYLHKARPYPNPVQSDDWLLRQILPYMDRHIDVTNLWGRFLEKRLFY